MTTHTIIHASPGSGKTTYLLKTCSEYLEQGARVLLISFTKVAANELKERMPKDTTGNVNATTLHSLVYGLVGVQRGAVVDNRKKKEFGDLIGMPISSTYDPNGESDKEITEADEAMAIISRADANMVEHIDEYYKSERPLAVETFRYISESYKKWKEANMYIDFNDMLMEYVASPTAVNYDILCLDESQDLSKLQWAVVHELQKTMQHVICVGDLEQNLFTFGGADPHGMHTYQERYKATSFTLPQSYRIPRVVHVIAEKLRERMSVRSHTEYRPRDAEGTVKYLNSLTELVYDTRDTLVLYRTHSLRKDLEDDLIDKRIVYSVLAGYPSLWDGTMGQAVHAYKKAQQDMVLSSKEEKALEKWGIGNVLKDSPWYRHMLFSSRITQYFIDTEGQEPTVRLSTIHGAKGKEAERVILYTGITQRITDGFEIDPDTEHRVFYVGVTRAKSELVILTGENNYVI